MPSLAAFTSITHKNHHGKFSIKSVMKTPPMRRNSGAMRTKTITNPMTPQVLKKIGLPGAILSKKFKCHWSLPWQETCVPNPGYVSKESAHRQTPAGHFGARLDCTKTHQPQIETVRQKPTSGNGRKIFSLNDKSKVTGSSTFFAWFVLHLPQCPLASRALPTAKMGTTSVVDSLKEIQDFFGKVYKTADVEQAVLDHNLKADAFELYQNFFFLLQKTLTKIIRNSDASKASGIDGLQVQHYKNLSPSTVKFLAKIFCKIIHVRQTPLSWLNCKMS